MSDFDVCVYCHASGCLGGTVTHDSSCPQATNAYPVTAEDLADPRGMCCTACGEPFQEGDTYCVIAHDDHWMLAEIPPSADAGFVTCISCAALGREPQ